MMAAYDSFLVLTARDENCSRYVEIYSREEAERKLEKAGTASKEKKAAAAGEAAEKKAQEKDEASALKKAFSGDCPGQPEKQPLRHFSIWIP